MVFRNTSKLAIIILILICSGFSYYESRSHLWCDQGHLLRRDEDSNIIDQNE